MRFGSRRGGETGRGNGRSELVHSVDIVRHEYIVSTMTYEPAWA